MTKEFITHDKEDKDGWICVCGNTPMGAGFFACDKNGVQMEPDVTLWKEPLYVCDACLRIINGLTHEVIGRATTNRV